MHALDKWIKEQSISRAQLAKNLNISLASLSRYLSGDRIPKQSIMQKIVTETDGNVNPSNFYTTKTKNIIYSDYNQDHLLGIEGLDPSEITSLLDRADEIIKDNRIEPTINYKYKGRTLVNLFFEDSTRTKTSFELAAKRLGMDVINMQIETSSIRKGESLLDTAMTLNAMKPDILVIRHSLSGTPHLLANKVNCAVINAGDGQHEHPTQALLDALAIRRRKKKISGLEIAICGDIAHSRVARSNIKLLITMGANVKVIAPTTLIPQGLDEYGAKTYNNMKEGLKNTDIVMILRLQHERMQGAHIPSAKEYFKFYGLDRTKLNFAKENALVMHPGPINRGVEIDSELADDINRTLILEQVELGVAIRMSVIEHLINNLDNKKFDITNEK
ncbi:aspartate carbamoyltransferase catalytic subunit [Alphaproteobacteria bacterium]|nr:aspartate carbamoyltransferase catalytic subunit [Alphaproteobacteria bacterium]